MDNIDGNYTLVDDRQTCKLPNDVASGTNRGLYKTLGNEMSDGVNDKITSLNATGHEPSIINKSKERDNDVEQMTEKDNLTPFNNNFELLHTINHSKIKLDIPSCTQRVIGNDSSLIIPTGTELQMVHKKWTWALLGTL